MRGLNKGIWGTVGLELVVVDWVVPVPAVGVGVDEGAVGVVVGGTVPAVVIRHKQAMNKKKKEIMLMRLKRFRWNYQFDTPLNITMYIDR